MACAYVQMGKKAAALTCIEAVLGESAQGPSAKRSNVLFLCIFLASSCLIKYVCTPADNGFEDVDTLRRDPDLEAIRGAELEALVFK
jgi:hypothetical protein